jgi:hypothetical protein
MLSAPYPFKKKGAQGIRNAPSDPFFSFACGG